MFGGKGIVKGGIKGRKERGPSLRVSWDEKAAIVVPEQQLHLTTSRGSGLRQIKYFKLNRGRRGSVAGKAVRMGWVAVGVGGFFPPYLLLSSFSPGRREFSFYNKRP